MLQHHNQLQYYINDTTLMINIMQWRICIAQHIHIYSPIYYLCFSSRPLCYVRIPWYVHCVRLLLQYRFWYHLIKINETLPGETLYQMSTMNFTTWYISVNMKTYSWTRVCFICICLLMRHTNTGHFLQLSNTHFWCGIPLCYEIQANIFDIAIYAAYL